MGKQFALVLMPFKDEFLNVYRYGIRAAFEDVKDRVFCQRMDEQEYDGLVIDRIYNQIQRADYVIADMSERNANVFYEVGYAHALQKKVVLLAQSHDDIPFDLNQYPHIYYDRNHLAELSEKLKKRVDYYLSSTDAVKSAEVELNAYINQSHLETAHRVRITVYMMEKKLRNGLSNYDLFVTGSLHILLKNETSRVFDSIDTGISVFFSDNMPLKKNPEKYKILHLPDGRQLVPEFFWGSKIYPYSYWENTIDLYLDGPPNWNDNPALLDGIHSGEIQINSPYAQQIYPFEIQFQVKEQGA